MDTMSIEILIIDLVHQEIARNCAIGEWDWQIETQTPTPTPRELLVQSARWCEDATVADLFLLSALVCADNLSIYQIDDRSDSDYRQALLKSIPADRTRSDLVCYFTAMYADEDLPDPDPQADPFYYCERLAA
jgi:hypothetical protein